MLSIHNNLSAGAQNVIGAYVMIMLVYRHLLTTRLQARTQARRRLLVARHAIGREKFGESSTTDLSRTVYMVMFKSLAGLA